VVVVSAIVTGAAVVVGVVESVGRLIFYYRIKLILVETSFVIIA
jgi:hypothetical protein